MSSKTIIFLTFAVGAAIGSITTWQFIKKKYEEIAQEEIDSVKEVFSKKEPNIDVDIRTKAEQAKEKSDVAEYAAKLNTHGYTNYSNSDVKTDKKEEASSSKPYVIPPEEFGEIDGYDKIGLSYYADQILADENDDVIEDVEETVGFDSLNHFGKYEDDSVFVRNDRLKCDYEILLDQRKYSDVSQRKPHQTEG